MRRARFPLLGQNPGPVGVNTSPIQSRSDGLKIGGIETAWIQSLRKAAEALEQAGNALRGRQDNPNPTASAVNEAGKYLVSAALQLKGAADELGDIPAERKPGG